VRRNRNRAARGAGRAGLRRRLPLPQSSLDRLQNIPPRVAWWFLRSGFCMGTKFAFFYYHSPYIVPYVLLYCS